MFIKLTLQPLAGDGTTIPAYLNADNIMAIVPEANGATIETRQEQSVFRTRETPEEIIALIEAAKPKLDIDRIVNVAIQDFVVGLGHLLNATTIRRES